MSLISLLIVMGLERLMRKSPAWHIHAIAGRYFTILQKRDLFTTQTSMFGFLLIAVIPGLILWLLLAVSQSALLLFLSQLLVLWVCLGCPLTRKRYKQYLQAADRQDFEACSLHSMGFGNKNGDLAAVPDQLVYINYRQYAAVVIFFILLGAPGVLIYSLAKELQTHLHKSALCDASGLSEDAEISHDCVLEGQQLIIDRIMHGLDWLPVRITGLGFLIVGHFTRALGVWLPALLDFSTPAKEVLVKVAKASEDTPVNTQDCSSEPAILVRLVKRNILFMLVALSLLTVVGAVN